MGMTEKEKVGRYEILEKIGRGGMATVFKGYDPVFERDVAIKIMSKELSSNETFLIRFKREAKIVAALEHPAIVPVYDFGDTDGKSYIIMRLMQGGSMDDILENKTYSYEEVVKIVKRLCTALVEAHEKGIIHRDIKPANILFDHRVDAFLTDFGIAKMLEDTQELTKTGILGTLEYMSPEQAQGDDVIDHRSDIYSMALIIYEMLTGQGPFIAETPIQIALKHLYEAPPNILELREDLPEGLGDILLKALEKDPDSRYQKINEMVVDMEALLGNGSTGAIEDTMSAGMENSLEIEEDVVGGGRLVSDGDMMIDLNKKKMVVGRNAVLDIDLTKIDKNKFVSKQHAELEYREGEWYIKAHDNSKNPTKVNGERIKKGDELKLHDGDEIEFADLKFTFQK